MDKKLPANRPSMTTSMTLISVHPIVIAPGSMVFSLAPVSAQATATAVSVNSQIDVGLDFQIFIGFFEAYFRSLIGELRGFVAVAV